MARANHSAIDAGGRTPDEVDPELLALPAPPSGRRFATLALMALVVVASMALTASLRHDLRYFFASAEAAELGDVSALDPSRIVPNSYVRITGTPMASTAVRYTRVVSGETYVVFPFGGQRTVFVHVPESEAHTARTEFAGRIVTFSQLGGRMRGVRDYLGQQMQMPVSGESFVLLADEAPASYGWSLLLALLCAAFVAIDLWLVLRWFRPLPSDDDSSGEKGPAAA